MYSEQLGREIWELRSRSGIDKDLNGTSTDEEIGQYFRQIEKAHVQFDKELKERGIGWFIFTHGREPGEIVAAKLVEFIENETGIKIETAYVGYAFYTKVNRT